MGESTMILFPVLLMVFYLAMILFVLVVSFITSVISALLFGAIPLMCGIMKNKKTLGIVGFIVSSVLCFFHGAVLAQLASAVFVFLIIREKKEEPKVEE